MSNTRVLVLGMSITAIGYAFQIGANSWGDVRQSRPCCGRLAS